MYIQLFYDAAIILMPLKTFYVSFFFLAKTAVRYDPHLFLSIQLLYTAFFRILTVCLPDKHFKRWIHIMVWPLSDPV